MLIQIRLLGKLSTPTLLLKGEYERTSPKDYRCPVCGAVAAPQIVRTFPPKMMKCPKCGFVAEEQRFLHIPEPRQNLPA